MPQFDIVDVGLSGASSLQVTNLVVETPVTVTPADGFDEYYEITHTVEGLPDDLVPDFRLQLDISLDGVTATDVITTVEDGEFLHRFSTNQSLSPLTLSLEGQPIFQQDIGQIGTPQDGETRYYILDDSVGVDAHDPENETDSRVYVNGTRIPVAGGDVHLRKEGPLDVTRYAEIEFPAIFEGNAYVDLFDTLEPDSQEAFDELYIELKDPSSGVSDTEISELDGIVDDNISNDGFVPTFRGVITGVGATDTGGIWTCRAQGPAHLLASIPADQQFASTTANNVLEYITQTANERMPFDVRRGTGSNAVTGENITIDDVDIAEQIPVVQDLPESLFTENFIEGLFTDQSDEITNKTFQPNRHTLKDVVTWLRGKTRIRLWFRPRDGGITLVPMRNPNYTTYRAHYLDGDLQVVENNAVSEIAPINTLTAKGQATGSRFGLGLFNQNATDQVYYAAKVQHTSLYERAGDTELIADTFAKSDGQTTDEVANDAADKLKERIDEATEGDMITLLDGRVEPFTTVEAQPTCRTEAEQTTPITYEVSRVHHEINPDDGLSRSRLNVGIHTDIEEDIEVVDTWDSEDTGGDN